MSLDKASEKVLKYIISKYSGSLSNEIRIIRDELNLDGNTILSICDELEAQRYLECNAYRDIDEEPFLVWLTHKGLHYFDEKTSNEIRFWIPVIISNLIALFALIVAILAYIKQ